MQRRVEGLKTKPDFEWYHLHVALSKDAFFARSKLENFMFDDPKFKELPFYKITE